MATAALPPHRHRLDEFLRELSHETLRQRFNHARMVALEIYAKLRARNKADAPDEVYHLLEAFDSLVSFVAVTAQRGEGAIAYLT